MVITSAVRDYLLALEVVIAPYIYAVCRLVFGTLYPAYASYKAVRTKNVKEYVSKNIVCVCTLVRWLMLFMYDTLYDAKFVFGIYLSSCGNC